MTATSTASWTASTDRNWAAPQSGESTGTSVGRERGINTVNTVSTVNIVNIVNTVTVVVGEDGEGEVEPRPLLTVPPRLPPAPS